jgi:hypothetical protein
VKAHPVERDGATGPLHEVIGEAIERGARLVEESRVAINEIQDSIAALNQTVAAIRRARAERLDGTRRSETDRSMPGWAEDRGRALVDGHSRSRPRARRPPHDDA